MRYVKQILIRQEDVCMFFNYSLQDYNVNNRQCVYLEIETVYAISLVFQEVILNMEDLDIRIHSLGHLEQYHQHQLLACRLYTSKKATVYQILGWQLELIINKINHILSIKSYHFTCMLTRYAKHFPSPTSATVLLDVNIED